MAQPTTAKFGAFTVSLWDGTAFVAPCGFTSKSLTLSRNLSEVSIPDCDDPDAPFWTARDVSSMSASISGEGLLAAEAVPLWADILDGTDSVQAQVEIAFSSGTLAYAGLMHIESMAFGAESGGRVTANVSLQSDGQLAQTWTPA